MIRQKNKNLIRKILRSAGRMFTGLLASGVIALSGLPGIFVYNSDVFALKSGIDKANAKAVTNGYMLEITTGMHNGDDIEFIEIGYDGTDGKKYKQFLFPGEDSLANGRAQAYLVANDNNIATDFFNKYDYSIKSKWNDVGRQTGLRTDATDQYFFLTEKPIKKITKFDAFLGKKGKWTCLRLQLFKVDTIDGLRMAGNFSNSWYIDYTGTLMAELRNGQSNTWTDDNANYLHMTQKADLVTTFAEGENVTRGAQKKYGIRIDFADVYNAGLEYTACDYDTKELQFYNYEPVEALAVTFKYVDIFGYDRSFTAPVVLNSVYWAYKKNFQKEKIMGFAQQGESLFFEGVLPDFAALRSASLTVGRTDAEKATDINLTGAGNKRTKMGMASDDDDVKISAMALYDMETATVTPYQEGACLKYKFEGDPVYYHVATDYTGENAYAGETTSFDFKPYDKKPLTPVDNGEYYLIQFTTDNLASAGTSGDLFLQLTYANLNGYETKSAEISLREATRDLYGYWPSKMEDFAYMRGTSPGQTMQAVFVLKDVARFTGLTLRMGETNADDYQFKDLKIFALGSRGKRIIKFEDQNVGKNSTHLSITRDFSTLSESGVAYPEDQDPNKISILDIGDTVLIQQGDEIPVDFISAEVGTVIDTKWDLYSYSVSYADATQNFRFTKARKTFNVAVKVYDDTVAGEGTNGDSGSENLFYFQILFENGCSGYVLANRQIKGDSFVSGDTANFQISTNADYGNIIGIRIIPDDSSDNNKKYDKLNVDSIRISELGVTGTHTVWVADNVGWIDIGYTEEMEKNGLGGRPGRTEADLSKTLNIDYTTSAIQLEIAIRTISGDQMEGAADQYRGTLSVDVNYIKNNGEHDHTGAKDAVSLMYQYMNKKGSGDAGGTVSQISSMFRENHTDRFFIELEDVQKLVSLDLSMVQKDDPYTWNIGGVSIRMITDVGKLRLNAYDEYEYQREEEPPILCIQRSETVPAYHPWLTKDGQQKLNIPLTDNKIEIYDNYSTKISAVAREPASKNDELNIFLFPNMTESNPMDEYDLDVLVHYAHVYGNIYQTGGRLSKYTPPAKSTNSPMFYIHGLKASGMVDLNSLVVSADSEHPYTNMAVLDHAVVQQVRNGVVVKNYYIDLKNGNAFYTVREYPSSNAAAVGYQDSQVLTFQLGENTVAKNLFAEKIDMAVALRYKVENDPSDIEYLTPYIYLTDQNVVKIRDGQMVDITFNNMFMGEITGINVAAVGDVTAGIEGACIACYRKDSQGNTDEIGYYSFGNPVTVTPGNVVSMKQTANTETDKNSVRPVTITFDTSVASNLYESGTSDPVWMQVYTVDADGNIDDTTVFEDIKKYLTDGAKSFATDKVQSIRFLVKGAQSLRRIIVEPKSNSAAGNAGWSLDSVVVKLGNDDPITRSVNERVTEGTPKTITLSNISVQAEVYYKFEAGQKSYTQERVKEDGKKLVALHEDMFVILPYIYGSELGNTVSVVEVTDDGYESGLLTDLLVKDNDNRYVFTPPKSETTKNYKITVASSEVPQANINIYVKVVGVEPPKTEPENTEGTEESGKTGETGENGQTGNTGETGETGNTGESGEDSKSEDREGDSENDTNNAEDTPAVVIHIGGGEEP